MGGVQRNWRTLSTKSGSQATQLRGGGIIDEVGEALEQLSESFKSTNVVSDICSVKDNGVHSAQYGFRNKCEDNRLDHAGKAPIRAAGRHEEERRLRRAHN